MACSMATKRTPMFIGESGIGDKLQRIPFMSGTFNEAWLQQLLADNPDLIPAEEFGNDYSPLVCIGREVPVGNGDTKGYIDNLYISPSGAITIVETKLFRNQEARREVVAQIIDYAKELQKWDSKKLNKVASDYFYKTEGQAANIIDVMARRVHLTLSDEGVLNDNINFNLKNAHFLLLIIGDGIRSGIQQLAQFLNENTSMRFNLALAEMEIYRFNDGVIAIPNVITKSVLIERYADEPISFGKSNNIIKPVLSMSEFIKTFADYGGYNADEITEFVLDMEAIPGLSVQTTRTELTIRFRPAQDKTYALFTFSISLGHADFYVMPGRIQVALHRHGFFPFDADDFLEFYKPYVDVGRCKSVPYEDPKCFYYADMDIVLQHTKEFITAAEKFAVQISN